MSPKYIEPTTTTGRVRIAMPLAGAVLLYLVLYFSIPRYMRTLPACDAILWLKAVAFAFVLVSTAICLALLRSIWRGLRAGQWPLPGSDVLFRTKVVTGWRLGLEAAGRASFVGIVVWMLTMTIPPTIQLLEKATNVCNA